MPLTIPLPNPLPSHHLFDALLLKGLCRTSHLKENLNLFLAIPISSPFHPDSAKKQTCRRSPKSRRRSNRPKNGGETTTASISPCMRVLSRSLRLAVLTTSLPAHSMPAALLAGHTRTGSCSIMAACLITSRLPWPLASSSPYQRANDNEQQST